MEPRLLSIIIATNCIFLANLCINESISSFASTTPNPDDNVENVTLRVLFDEFNKKGMGKSLVDNALEKLRLNHPDVNIEVEYTDTPYSQTKRQIENNITNGNPIDIISVDQIWLGDLADKGLLTDLTGKAEDWGRLSDFYQSNIDGMIYNNTVYGIWAWTDVRGIWYWKDLLEEAGVDAASLTTWDGYIAAAKKLNSTLGPRGISAIHLTGANHSADLWYPYLWMLGGEILRQREGYPSGGSYWFPAFNSTEGVEALLFIQDQVKAGIEPQTTHSWGKEFSDRNFSVMIEGSWLPSNLDVADFSRVGFIPAFPTPDNDTVTATLMGGWEFAIPQTSPNKDLAWELISLMLEPHILSPWLAKSGYLPTQLIIGEGSFSEQLRKTNPYYDNMVSMIPLGGSRPSIPAYPVIADAIRSALDGVYYHNEDPKVALNRAAEISAEKLGW
ncbi:MAG TPA: extracellular solute-binding protein [Nitrososphaeraceae archaeon]|nr:extracellular solute-binding protein [Nitrososphaeraceae archaeon]